MDVDDYLAALDRDGRALAAAADGRLSAPVAPCPGWSMADLVWHTGKVHSFWRDIVEHRRSDPSSVARPDRSPDDGLLAWYADGLDRVLAVLRAADPSTPLWTWASQKDVAFVQRRMAQETAVHRWDAESAAGSPGPVDHEVAVDGVDEFCSFFLALDAPGAQPVGGSVHLHATDGDGEWLVRPDGERFTVTRGHEKGDVALRGSASDLLLALWRRLPIDRLDVVGDRGVGERFLAASTL